MASMDKVYKIRCLCLGISIGAVFPLLYLLCQIFRFTAFIMFTNFMVYCTVYHSETSVNCNNYTQNSKASTPGCNAYCWKGLWILCSIISSSTALFIIITSNKHIQQLRPASNAKILKTLITKPYFWSLNLIFLVVILYDALIETQHLVYGSSSVEVGVIVSKCLTLSLIFQLNFTYPPKRSTHSLSNIGLYYITLVLFLLDNLCKFMELSIRVSYKLYSMNTKNDRQKEVLCLMLETIDAMLYHSFLTFFWSKIFRGSNDVLMVYTPDLSQSLLGQQETQLDYQPL